MPRPTLNLYNKFVKKQVLIPIVIVIFLFTATVLVVFYGKGYRLDSLFDKPKILETGLLVATSQPDGSQVFVNGHLTTATNNTINLSPNTYKIKIAKEGYFSWEKTIKIQKEIVQTTGALLFAKAPKLESITENGVLNPVVDPSGAKIAFTIASQSAKINGVYILDMTARSILTLQSASTQIANDISDTFSKASLQWSPDGKELLAVINSAQDIQYPTIYLLKTNSMNQNPQDVTATIDTLNADWKEEKSEKERSRIDSLNTKLKKLISENFNILSWSPDETKILYTASKSAVLNLVISPPLIGTDSTPQERNIQKDLTYIYDIKEDKNFKITHSSNFQVPLTWLADSKHLIYVENRTIGIMEYDESNKTIIYAGPFTDSYVFPWTDVSKIVILTNLGNANTSPSLYTIGLK